MSGIVRANNAGQSGIASNAETIDSDDYVDASIDNAHLADNAADSDEIAAGAIDTAHIADNQVTLAKMAGITRGSIIYGDASGNPAALAKGTETYVLTAGADDISWAAAAAGGATSRAGGNTGEASTVSTGAVEILQAASLGIAGTAPFQGFAAIQKTAGHASTSNTGWYLAGTRVAETVWTTGNNGLEGGGWYLQDCARLGNPYEGSGMLWTFSGDGTDIAHNPGAVAYEPTGTTDTIGVLGKVANAGNTFRADELQVYGYTIS